MGKEIAILNGIFVGLYLLLAKKKKVFRLGSNNQQRLNFLSRALPE
jgi:hypothetical protein